MNTGSMDGAELRILRSGPIRESYLSNVRKIGGDFYYLYYLRIYNTHGEPRSPGISNMENDGTLNL